MVEARYETRESFSDIVAANIRALAGRLGISQKELAPAVGLSQGSVSNRWTGKMQWQLEDLDKVAAVFGVQPWELTQPPADMRNARRLASVSDSYTAGDLNPEPIDSELAVVVDFDAFRRAREVNARLARYA